MASMNPIEVQYKAADLPEDRTPPAPSAADTALPYCRRLCAVVQTWLTAGKGKTLTVYCPPEAYQCFIDMGCDLPLTSKGYTVSHADNKCTVSAE